ncbi:helix-turn-helix domain-containing protein [Herbiconiux liukaitaii]|uniref:helix-turn-helix domain-containing protein n=1 Tax=Herbiconiux liukaitaii TaxID=3342799 RepID=UPI0035BAEBD1
MTSLSAIGARLRTAREAQNLTLKALADAMGVTPSLLSQIENDKVQPSLNTLYHLALQLELSVDELLGIASGRDTRRPGPVQRFEDNPVVELESGVRLELLAGGASGIVEPLMVTYRPHSSTTSGALWSRHLGYDFGVLLEGELTLRLGFEEHVIRSGDSVHFDTTQPHVYVNDSTHTARGVWFTLRHPPERATTAASTPGSGIPGSGLTRGRPGSLSDVLNALHNHDDWG